MLNIKNISVKNFMSVGNNVQGVRFDDKHLTLGTRQQPRPGWRW